MNKTTRINFSSDPDTPAVPDLWRPCPWPAKWIRARGWDKVSPVVMAFRRRFSCKKGETASIFVAADQRYDLWLDGVRIGLGNERGVHSQWFYEGYRLQLDPGKHTLVARVWWIDEGDLTHLAHETKAPGFLLHSEMQHTEKLDTREGVWDAKILGGYSFPAAWLRDQIPNAFVGIGSRTRLVARREDFGWEKGGGSGWEKAEPTGESTQLRSMIPEGFGFHSLSPAILPAMFEKEVTPGKVRFAISRAASNGDFPLFLEEPIKCAESDQTLARSWQGVHSATPRALTIPPKTVQRIVFDLGNYYCAYPRLKVSGGAGSEIRIGWTEAPALKPDGSWEKGNRNEIDGRFFNGEHDDFLPDGGVQRVFEPLWFGTGRYVQVTIRTAAEPLRLSSFTLRETHYPIKWDFAFESDDRRWPPAIDAMKRTLEMCSHESYFDCPYYEQLMYAGDSRLEILATYATGRDDRLPRKAMILFDRSRAATGGGLTLSRIPSRRIQVIPPYSLHWIMMVHDFAMWRRDEAFIRERLDGVRAVLLAFNRNVGDDGLLRSPVGWNFTDWVPGWNAGLPPGANPGEINATLNFHFAWVLKLAAELEDIYGEKEFAIWARNLADKVGGAAVRQFWDDSRNLFAEDVSHKAWSEHAQCMAVLGGFVPEKRVREFSEALATAPDLARATVYYSFYILDAFRKLGREKDLHSRFGLWHGLKAGGFKTVPEMPEPSRSDCHAWGSHPLYHLLCSVAGIRPDAPGFRKIRIAPMPGDMRIIKAQMPHPDGQISVRLKLGADNQWHGEVSTPENIPTTLALPGKPELRFSGKTQI